MGQTADLEARVTELVRESLRVRVVSLQWLEGQLGLRRFARVQLAGEPTCLIARVDAAEDPAGRPADAAPEPPLEPIRALLEANGLPVPACYASGEGLELLEDLGDVSLQQAA